MTETSPRSRDWACALVADRDAQTIEGTLHVCHVPLWRDLANSGDQPLRARCLIMPTTRGAGLRFAEDRPVRLLAATEHTRIPAEWLRNAYSIGRAGGA